MKKNLGPLDRLIRLLLGNIMILLATFGLVGGVAGLYLFFGGVFILLTSFISFCPFYALAGFSTKK